MSVQFWLNNGVIEELDADGRQFVQDMIKVLAERKYIMIGYSMRLFDLNRSVFLGFIALDVPFKPPAVKQSVELMRTLGYKQLYYCRYNMHSVKAFMEALSLETQSYAETDKTYWPLIGPAQAPVINDWDQFGWNNIEENNNNDAPPPGDPPIPPNDEAKIEEAKRVMETKVILHGGDLDYNTANKLLNAAIVCTHISARNTHHLTGFVTTLTTLVSLGVSSDRFIDTFDSADLP
jgi:hypothetical protein